MANSQPFRTTPQLGPQLDDVFTGLPYWDGAMGIQNADQTVTPSYKLGNKEVGNDGHDYIFLKASAAISPAVAPGAQLTITEPAFTAVGGGTTSGWYAPTAGVQIGQYFHARKGAIGVP